MNSLAAFLDDPIPFENLLDGKCIWNVRRKIFIGVDVYSFRNFKKNYC
jgi:hypothetical protein